MYYGYMQRGLSIAMMLILCVMAATVVQPLLFLCLVIWMYSFFDTMTSSATWQPVSRRRIPCWFRAIMRRSKAAPTAQQTDRLGPGRLRRLALYDTFISTWLYTLLCSLVGNGYATTSSPAYRMLSLRHC